VVVAGTGKMARNIGRFLAGRDVVLTFASASAGRLGELEAWARKRMRPAFQRPDAAAVPGFVCLAEPPAGPSRERLATATIVVEATREERGAKAERLRLLASLASREALLVSSSSSILPSEIHPGCVGLHFFYPVELTGFVELVTPDGLGLERRDEARSWCTELALRVVEQTERAAFVANRLLLPLQAECARALARGQAPSALDAATVSDLLPVGQLALMDAVGLDVVAAAVDHYLSRMTPEQARTLHPLPALLHRLVADGRLGEKAGGGIGVGEPWPPALAADLATAGADAGSAPPDPGLFRALFVNACLGALDAGQVDRVGLATILDGLYGGSERFDRVVASEGPAMRPALEALFARTGRWYWSPAPSLGAARP
jgi:3-hydroxyacyl-CoA dehydrogenase